MRLGARGIEIEVISEEPGKVAGADSFDVQVAAPEWPVGCESADHQMPSGTDGGRGDHRVPLPRVVISDEVQHRSIMPQGDRGWRVEIQDVGREVLDHRRRFLRRDSRSDLVECDRRHVQKMEPANLPIDQPVGEMGCAASDVDDVIRSVDADSIDQRQ